MRISLDKKYLLPYIYTLGPIKLIARFKIAKGDVYMEWMGFFFFFLLALFIALLLWGATSIFGPKNISDVKAEPFECGVEPKALPRGRFDIKFYLVAMLFVIFDIELIYLFPWALLYRKLGVLGFVEMFLFLAIVVLGLVYAWKKNALEWE